MSASIRRAIDGLVAVVLVVVFLTASGGFEPGDSPAVTGPDASSAGASPASASPTSASPTCPAPLWSADNAAPDPGWGAPVLVQDFSGPDLDPACWGVYDSPDQTPPRSPHAVRVSGGELQLTGGFNPTVGTDVSGGVESTLNQLYGRWEARFRVDQGAGYSAVVLLWPESERWPTDGEVDVAEVNLGDRQSAVNYLHNGSGDEKIGLAVDWLPGQVTFYLDGAIVFGQTGPPYVPGTSPMHLTLQLDQGCDAFIECRNASTPAQVIMHVDWVKAYQLPRTGGSNRHAGQSTVVT